MATKRPVLCPNCGAQVRKSGYCSACYMHIGVLRKAYNTSNYYYNIGYDKAAARDLSGAIESLNMSLRYNKKNVMSRNLLGLIYYEMGEVVMALSHWVMSTNYQTGNNIAARYLKELNQDPTRLSNEDQIAKKFNMALHYAHTMDYDLAIIQLKGAIKDNPHFVKGYLLLALLHIQNDNYEKARKTLKRVLKIDKANPVAIRYLHEMGDTDEHIIHMRMESVENDGLFDEDYEDSSIELEPKKDASPRSVIQEIKAKYKDTTIKTGEFGEVNFAKYSGLYVLVGLVLGILILFFLIVPAQKNKIREENEELIKSYSEELSSKNAEIISLNSEIDDLNRQLDLMTSTDASADNPLPDYSDIQSGMSDEDINSMLDNE